LGVGEGHACGTGDRATPLPFAFSPTTNSAPAPSLQPARPGETLETSSDLLWPQRSHSKKCVSIRVPFSLGSMRHRCIIARQQGQLRSSIRNAVGLECERVVPAGRGVFRRIALDNVNEFLSPYNRCYGAPRLQCVVTWARPLDRLPHRADGVAARASQCRLVGLAERPGSRSHHFRCRACRS
jgi:hypothetical protein